jgi:O-antigen ligase
VPAGAPAPPGRPTPWRSALELTPLIAVCALLLSTGVEILPSGAIFWKLTLGRLLVLIALAALIASGARLRDFRTGLDGPIALLVAAGILTTLRHPLAGVDEAAPLRFLLTVVVFYYVTVGMCRRSPAVRLALPMVATFAIVASAVVGVQQVAQDQFTGFYRDGFTPVVSGAPRAELLPRARGSFANPNLLASHVLLLAPLAVAFALSAVAREVRVALFALAALAYLGLLLTFSRAGVGAAIVAGSLVAYAMRPAWRPRLRLAALVAAVVLGVGALAISGDLVGGFGRTEAWSLSIDVARDNPVTGVGLGRAGDALTAAGDPGDSYRHSHNLWLSWLVEAGPLALAAWVWIAGWLLWRGYRAATRRSTLAASCLAAVTGFFVFSMFDHPANVERIATAFWFVAALIAAGVRPPRGVWPIDRRRVAAAGAGVLVLIALAGCGGDSEPNVQDPRTDPPESVSTGTDREPTTTTPEQSEPAEPTVTTPEPSPPATSPEDQPGGAGDEEPIGVDAEFTGRNGKVTPPLVQVPPFIAVTVRLTSADGDEYAIRIGGRRLVVGPGKKHAEVQLDGLRQGASYPGTVEGGGTVDVRASAEPGP